MAISEYPYGTSHVIYSNAQLYGTSFALPGGVLEYGEKYRWNMQSHNSAGWGDVSSLLYFQTLSETLSVSLSANPSEGTAPLNGVDLTAEVSGSATGSINYTFYCDRSDSGTDITPGWAAKLDGIFDNPKTVVDVCDYSTLGIYTAKVIAECGSEQAEDRVTITVGELMEPLTLAPLYPVSDLLSSIMQGGTVHQHFEVRDAGGTPAPFVTVTFSPAGGGTSDANGLLDVAVDADDLGGPGNYNVTSVVASRWGQTYTLANAVNFAVEVHRRELISFWGSGAGMHARAGVSAGVIGYVKGAHEGGLDAKLTEQYPLSETDDTLRMTASQTNEAGGGVGLGAKAKFTAGPVKGSASASTETGLTWKALEEYTSVFNDPYASEQQRAAAITALVGIYRTCQGFAQGIPGLNLLGQIILEMLEQNPDYCNYLDEETIGTGVALENSADIGGKLDLLHFGKYSRGIRRSRFLHLQAGAEFDADLHTLLKWTTDPNTDATRALSWCEEATGIAWGGLEAGLTYGARAKWAREISAVYSIERQADYASDGALQKQVFTVSSETRDESQAGVDIDPLRPANINWGAIADKGVQYQIQHRYIFEGDALTQALTRAPGLGQLNVVEQMSSSLDPIQLGQMAAQRDLTALLGCSPTCLNGFTYEKWAVITTDLQPGLDLGFTLVLDLELGGNFKVQWGKEVLLERGPFFDGDFYPVEVYTLDSYVDAPERDLWYLIGQAVQAAFDTISDFFNTVKEKIEAGKDWVIDVIARTREGIVNGGMRLIGAGGSLNGSLQATSTFTLTATAWVPTTNLTTTQQARLLGIQTTEASFVVGGVYDLQPYTQTLSPAATLVITYTDDAVAGRDESLFRPYRWEPADNAWRPLADPVDTANNTMTSTITSLGTYAIGFDDQPPVIEEIIPGPDADLATYLPGFRITLSDAGSGVDPASLQLTLAGTPVSAAFDPIQGLLWYSPTLAIANGVYTMSIQATDTTGNAITVTSPFTIAVPAPVVSGVSPHVIYESITTTVTITGTSFYPGLTLNIGEYTPPSVAYLSAGMLSVTMAPTSPLGIHAVTATNPDGLSGTLPDGLTVTITSDLNGDCVVDIVDIMQVASRWDCRCGDECYDPRYDFSDDCNIDVVDIMQVAARWGETCE